MRRRLSVALALAAPAALLLVAFPIVTAALAIPQFFDPCHEWGVPREGRVRLGPDVPCSHWSGSSQTKAQAIVRLIGFQGGLLPVGVLGLLAAWKTWRWALFGLGLLLVAATFVLVSSVLFAITFPAAALFFLAAIFVPSPPPTARPAEPVPRQTGEP